MGLDSISCDYSKPRKTKTFDCLICFKCVPLETRRTKGGDNFLELFEVLCKCMNWTPPSKFCFNFATENFPFCKDCKISIVRLHDLNEQLQNTQKQIVRGTASLCAKILESRNEKSLNVNLAQNDLDQSLRGNDGVDIDRKIGYYRNATYRRFSTSVHLIVDPSRKCKPNLEYQHKHGTSKVSLDFQDDLVGEQLSPTGFEVEMDHYQLIESVDHTSGELEGAIDAKETDEMLTMQEVEGEDWKDVSGTVILRRSGPEEGQNLRDDIESNEVFTNDIKDEDWNNEPETLSDSDEDKLKVGKNKRKYAARKFKRDVLTRYFGKCKFGNRVRFLSKEVRNLKFIFDDKHPFERSWEGKWTCSTCQHSFYGKKELLAHLAGTCNGLQRKNLEQEETEDNAQTEEIDAGNSFNEKIYIAIEDPLFRSFKNRLKKIGDSLFLLDEKCRFKCTKTLWRCISCDLPFQRKCRLRDHLNYCPGDPSTDASEAHRYRGCIYDKLKCGNFQCRFCRILCSSDEAMIGHLKECHVGKFNRDRDKPSYVEVEPNKYVCNQKFPFELVDENFKCGTCFKNFSMRSEIVTHIQKEHLVAAQKRRAVFSNPSPGKFIAEGFSFEKIGDEYKCDHCTYSSLKLTAIKDHLRRCHMDVKKVPCQLCEKRFNSGGDLRKHVKQVHKKERPYICELCGKSFKIMCSLRIHRAQVHPESSDKNFSCEICGKIYGSMALLRVHAKRHETVVCHLCGKDMISAKLAYHLARHNEENECGVCGKKFFHTSSLIVHEKSHEGIKPYSCDMCNEKFCHKYSVFKHKARRHNPSKPTGVKKTRKRKLRDVSDSNDQGKKDLSATDGDH